MTTCVACDVRQELRPKTVSRCRDTRCSRSLITSDYLAGTENSDTGRSVAMISVTGKEMVVQLHEVFCVQGLGHD